MIFDHVHISTSLQVIIAKILCTVSMGVQGSAQDSLIGSYILSKVSCTIKCSISEHFTRKTSQSGGKSD